jgi:CRISPR-associated protein Csc3
LVTGARIVVTESYLPLFNSCADFPETVVLDAPHQSVRHLLTSASARLRFDQLFGNSDSKRNEGDWIGGTFAAFSRAIELHIDTERVGGDLKLERFTRIARDLETDQLFIFSFLQEQMREAKMEVIPAEKAHHYTHIYHQFVNYYQSNEGDVMDKIATRHERIVELYSKFYSPFTPGKPFPKSHAIVRPIETAAKCIIGDTLNLTEDEIKLEMVGKLLAWLEIVSHDGATGKAIVHDSRSINKKEERLVSEFVDYFYKEIFLGYADGERSVLNNRLNRFKDACEVAFRRRYYKDKGQSADASTIERTADNNESQVVAAEMVSQQ